MMMMVVIMGQECIWALSEGVGLREEEERKG
jgi:hypothetical protein